MSESKTVPFPASSSMLSRWGREYLKALAAAERKKPAKPTTGE